MKPTMKRVGVGAVAALAGAAALYGVETLLWTQSEAAEFDKGTLEGLALASTGRLTLAPVFRELHDPALPQLWAAAAGTDGTLYAAGAEGKIVAVPAKGAARVLATLEGGVVHALAVHRTGDVYAAVSPGGKIYRVTAAGAVTQFAAPAVKYVWGLVFNTAGDLYVAAGDPGQVLRVTPGGQVTVVFDAEEAHVRSLALLPNGHLAAGTEPGGVVLRVTPQGEGFVLHQTGKREVTALAVAKDGTIYAAASGNRGAATAVPLPAPVVAAPKPETAGGAVQGQPVPVTVTPMAALPAPPTMGRTAAGVPGGSEVWRIAPDGEPLQVWSHPRALVYTLALDTEGRPVAGTGNEGQIYRINSALENTRLVTADPMQVTALAAHPGGGLFAVTANPGKVYRMGPELEKKGTVESELLDAGSFTYWGRLRWEGDTRGGAIQLETRSGNLDRAQKNWSAWAAVDAAKGGRIGSPAARFLGWRATLTAAGNGSSPELRLVEAAYQAKNVAPVVEQIEMVAANYKFPAPGTGLAASTTLSLGPIGQPRRVGPPKPRTEPAGAATLSYEKGMVSARWKAADANGDRLKYKVEIRGAGEREWMVLKEDVGENRISFDGSRFPDGRYRLRVTASDGADNYPEAALSAVAESGEFLIDNTAPVVTGLTARAEGSRVVVRFKAADALSPLMAAEYAVNGGEWRYAAPTTRITDSQEHDYEAAFEKPAGGEIVIAVKVGDENDNVAVLKTVVRP